MDTNNTTTHTLQRRKMPVEMFLKIWKREIDVYGTVWQNHVIFREYDTGATEISFSNIEVLGRVYLEKNNVKLSSLVLYNCQLGDCEFKNVDIQAVEIKKQSKTGAIYILDSKTGRLVIENSITTGNFVIVSSQMRDFLIEDSNIKEFSLHNAGIGSFHLLKNSIAGNITIYNSTAGTFEIRGNSSIERFSISKKSTIGDCKIVNSNATILTIHDESRLSKLRVWHSRLQRIEIKSNSFISQFKCQFNLHEPAHIVLEHSRLGHLNFNNSVYPEFTTLKISDCQINHLQLSNFCNYGSVFFSRLKPLGEWEDFRKDNEDAPIYKDGIPQFESKTGNPTLHFTDSDLGKIQFINCDLREFDRFEFSNTKMLDVFVADSQMPGDNAFCLPNDEKNPLKVAEQKRLAYGQFKKIYEAQGDMAGSLRYLAYEMDAYFWQLIRAKPWKIGEWMMLILNKISTNYGNNWLQGALVTSAVVFLCFANYLRLIGYEWGEYNEANVELFKELFSYSPHYLNPFRDKDSISIDDNLYISPTARFWDLFSRIIVAYFVYQTIQAFRKLGKSSG